ncbi:MAG TPA: hypothetical protein VF230_18385, partial [Acidimicrobiales bacterium]
RGVSGETDPTSTGPDVGSLYSIGRQVKSNTTTRTARRAVIFGVGIILGLSVLSGTASAAPKNEGPTITTEDNDTNENTPNNVSDDGDNAHPSGKDRSVEHGGSGNQGKAQSDPDDDGRGPDRSNGGADQPNGPGGVDLADQDGNNGCGNDDDFEDDNEGWCGKPEATGTPAPVAVVEPDVEPTVVTPAVAAQVNDTPAAPAAVVESAGAATSSAQVLGVTIERAASAELGAAEVLGVAYERGSLARTGFGQTTDLAGLGIALVGLGLVARKFSTRKV